MSYPILAYIDPGILTVAVQGLFALIFAAMTGYVLAPWRWIKSLFQKSPVADPSAEVVSPASLPGTEHKVDS